MHTYNYVLTWSSCPTPNLDHCSLPFILTCGNLEIFWLDYALTYMLLVFQFWNLSNCWCRNIGRHKVDSWWQDEYGREYVAGARWWVASSRKQIVDSKWWQKSWCWFILESQSNTSYHTLIQRSQFHTDMMSTIVVLVFKELVESWILSWVHSRLLYSSGICNLLSGNCVMYVCIIGSVPMVKMVMVISVMVMIGIVRMGIVTMGMVIIGKWWQL